MISIIIPVFNEINSIALVIERINFYKKDKEIIIIDDYSDDGTRSLLKEKKFKNTVLLFNDKNYGKGYSIRRGIKKAKGDIILIQDADLEYDPKDLFYLLRIYEKYNADVVYGSRFKTKEVNRVLFYWHSLGNKFLTWLSNIFTNLNLTDMEVCYKIFRASLIKDIDLKENRFGFEPEVTAKISKIKNIKIFEAPINYFGRTYEEGKKIGWKDGFSAIRCIIQYNLFK